MTHKLIKTENYLLVVDKSVVLLDKGDYYILEDFQHPWRWRGEGKRPLSELSFKIIAHLPLNGSHILEDLIILPPINDYEYHLKTTLITIDQYPTDFECEMSKDCYYIPKTITTAQGIQWVGKYR